jgi:hypothetical protein
MFYLCESEATATTRRPAGTEINPVLQKSLTLINMINIKKRQPILRG